MQEFIYRKLTSHVPKRLARAQPVLRDGTVSLFSVENLRSATPQTSRPVAFVLMKQKTEPGAHRFACTDSVRRMNPLVQI